MPPTRILIADHHPVFRAGLRLLIEQEPDLDCVAEAGTGAEAVDKARFHRPDVVVLDLRMPGLDGIGATRRIVQERPQAGVLLLTMDDDEASVLEAMRAGARGYVLKGSDERDIMRAVRAVASGDAIFGPAVAGLLLDRITQAPAPPSAPFPT